MWPCTTCERLSFVETCTVSSHELSAFSVSSESGVAEAKLIAMRLGRPPAGYGHWTLQLLADEMVALEIVDTISHETVRKVLKKMA